MCKDTTKFYKPNETQLCLSLTCTIFHGLRLQEWILKACEFYCFVLNWTISEIFWINKYYIFYQFVIVSLLGYNEKQTTLLNFFNKMTNQNTQCIWCLCLHVCLLIIHLWRVLVNTNLTFMRLFQYKTLLWIIFLQFTLPNYISQQDNQYWIRSYRFMSSIWKVWCLMSVYLRETSDSDLTG